MENTLMKHEYNDFNSKFQRTIRSQTLILLTLGTKSILYVSVKLLS